jgi:hypothetical protein
MLQAARGWSSGFAESFCPWMEVAGELTFSTQSGRSRTGSFGAADTAGPEVQFQLTHTRSITYALPFTILWSLTAVRSTRAS